jgi:anti-sigma28 factor (negative regulator of flagellin synthesis)
MRIDLSPPAAGARGAERTETPADQPSKVESQSGGQVDRVEVSDGAKQVQRIVNEAVKAAGSTQEIRRDVVERARALLASGELGRDSQKLASAIIDDLLERP